MIANRGLYIYGMPLHLVEVSSYYNTGLFKIYIVVVTAPCIMVVYT